MTLGEKRYDRAGRHGSGIPAEHHVPGGYWKWACDFGTHFRKTKDELHPYPTGRQGDGSDVSI